MHAAAFVAHALALRVHGHLRVVIREVVEKPCAAHGQLICRIETEEPHAESLTDTDIGAHVEFGKLARARESLA